MDTGGMAAFVIDPHLKHLCAAVNPKGLTVVDVGAGQGALANALAHLGATVIGVEIDASKVDVAKGQMTKGAMLLEGRAENLPIETGTVDLVCFVFSLHHVAKSQHDKAFAEARRVLKPGGRLHIVEPYAHGTMANVLRFVDDETEVRNAAHARLAALAQEPDIRLTRKLDYSVDRFFKDYAEYVSRIVNTDPTRKAALAASASDIQSAFVYNSAISDGIFRLNQPCCAYSFLLV